jgi:hypothetical protein
MISQHRSQHCLHHRLRHRIRFSGLAIVSVVIIAVSSAFVGHFLSAAPPNSVAALNSTAERIRRIDVPADRPSEWSRAAEKLTAVPREEFEQLLVRAGDGRRTAPRALMTSAHYAATLTGQTIRDGHAALSVQRVGTSPALVSLGSFNLAIQNFDWSKRPAVWGTDDTGESWLLADSAADVPSVDDLRMTWSAAGRNLSGEVDFDLQFPAAATSTFDLRVPRDQTVRATPEARRIDEGSDATHQVWRIQLAGDRRCRLAVLPTKEPGDRKPRILFEHELGAVVREEDLRFQAVFQIDVFDAPVSELVFSIPSSVDVYAVTYGTDVPLAWTRSNKNEPAGTLTVRLPGALLGRSRPLHIDGVATQKSNAPMTSPQIAVKDGVFLSGRQTLTIVAPLQLRSFRLTGYRQQSPVTPAADGENYTFLQLLPDAQIVLDVGRPHGSLTAHVQSLFETDDSAWTLTAEVTWTASSGGVFQTECQFPAEWEITDVRLAGETATTRLAGWEIQPQAGGGSLLTIEFLEALVPTVPRAVRVLARRRIVPVGSSFAVPVPHPLNCYTVETMLGVAISSNLIPFFSEEARVERISPPDDALLTSVRARRTTAGRSEFWFHRDATDAVGSLQLVSRLREVDASSETVIDAIPTEYIEQYRIRCQAEGAPIDRLLVYLTQPGSEIRWSLRAPRQVDLTAQRLPVTQHADWNCPVQGELWELRFPPLPVGPIEIEGRRGNRWTPSARPALLIVPQSSRRRGRVVLRHPASVELTIETAGLELQPPPPSDALEPDNGRPRNDKPQNDELQNEEPRNEERGNDEPRNGRPRSPAVVSQEWSFDRANAVLTLTPNSTERLREFPTMVSLNLRSLILANSQGFDLYRAQFQMENGVARDELRIRLPEPAVLQQVTVAGQTTVPTIQDGELLVSDVDAANRDIVELLYRVPSRGGYLRDVHQIVVPQVSATVLRFEWEFALPPSVKLHAEPRGVRLSRSLATPTWSERLFGPLGRARNEALFNPLTLKSWKALLQPEDAAPALIGELSRDLIAPAEWQVHVAVSAVLPTEIRLETWHSAQSRLLSWISLLLSLIAGLTLRIIGWKHRDRIAAFWLAGLLAVAFCGPSPYAEIAGGAIAGTLIALLAPRRSLIAPRSAMSQMVPPGSTQSFRWGPSVSLLLIACCLAASGYAQDPAAPPVVVRDAGIDTAGANSAAAAAGGIAANNPAVRETILVPVDADGRPSRTLPLVYAPERLLTALKEAAESESKPPLWLISSARYHVVATRDGSDSLSVKYRIHVLNPTAEQTITLPISDAVLTGVEACRVNGVPHPVASATSGPGFRITWSPPQESAKDGATDDPGDDSTDGANSVSKAVSVPRSVSFDLELDLKRVGNRTALGGGFSMKMPRVASTQWSIVLPEPAAFFGVAQTLGATTPTDDRRQFELDLGANSQIDFRWSQKTPEIAPLRLESSLLQFLDLRAAAAELKFRARCESLEGAFDVLEFDLPPNSLIREGDIRATNMLRAEVTTGAQGTPILRVLFVEPQRQTVTVDGALLIADVAGSGNLPLPRFGLVRGADRRIATVRNWWCLSVSPEFRLAHQNLDPDLLGAISPTEFLHAWGDTPPTGRPQLVFQPREGSTPLFSVAPQLPRRRAITWNQTGHISKRRLEWSVVSQLETSQAPVYQHTLLVDRRLQIEAVSVMENGAERLVRWSESRHSASPTRVVLFLSDKTTGVQQLTLRASMPIRFGRNMTLPSIRCEEVELVESRWELFRDADVDVDLKLPRQVPLLDALPLSPSENAPVLIARYPTADPDPKASIRVSARQARCAARTAIVLTQTDAATWTLTAQMKLVAQGESARRIGVRFPATIDTDRVRVSQAEPTWYDPADGWRCLDLTLPPDPSEVSLTFETLLEPPVRGEWTLPLPEPEEAVSHELNLVLGHADTWTPLVGSELKPDESPGWAAEFIESRQPGDAATEYRLEGTPVRLRRNTVSSQVEQPSVRLLDQLLWLTSDGTQTGITRAFLSQSRDAIEWETPDGFRLIAMFLDDRPLALPAVADGRLRVPLLGGARESVFVLIWQRSDAVPAGYFRRTRESLPWPSGIDVTRSLITVVPHRDAWAVPGSGFGGRDWLDAALDRLEMLLDRQQSLGNDPRAAAANRRLIDELQTQIARRLSVRSARPSATLTEQLNRWNRVVETMNRLEPSPTAPPFPIDVRITELEEPFIELPQTLRPVLSATEPAIHAVDFWTVDRRAVQATTALLLSLIVFPLLRRLIRIEWGVWLSAHTTIAWILLGILWWTCLTPGAFGPLIIAVAVIHAAIQQRYTDSSVVIEE